MKSRTKSKSESRRLEARRQRKELSGTIWKRLLHGVHPSVLLIGAVFYAVTLLVQFGGSESMRWARGQRVDRDITARVDFDYEDIAQTRLDRQAAAASAPNVFVASDAPLNAIRGQLKDLRQLAVACADDAEKFKTEAAKQGWVTDEAAARAFLELAREQKRSEYEDLVEDLVHRLSQSYIVAHPVDPNRKEIPRTSILRGRDQAPEVDDDWLIYIADDEEEVIKVVRRVVNTGELCPEPLQGPLASLIERVLLGDPKADPRQYSPLWRYSQEATAEKVEEAVAQVKPSMISHKKGVTLVKMGTVLGETELKLLSRHHAQYLLARDTDPELRRRKLLDDLGVAVVVLLVTAGLAAYTISYQDRVFQNPSRALGLASLMLLMIALSRVIGRLQYPYDLPPELSVFLLVIASALLTIAYDQRFAFGAGGALTILMVVSSRGGFGLLMTFLTAMGITVFLLRDIRTRSKIVGVGALAGAGAFVASMATGFMLEQEVKYVLTSAVVVAVAALLAGFIVQGILHYFERLFGVATSMTLLEWCDAGQPLLRRLAQETPGTYSHSLVLSQMAEEACEAIGARGLLARVGALYHDVGKTQKPVYFVENQEAAMNRHDRLSPTMSLLIIVGHVKDGVEMARAYGLPRILHQFIAEHHGTTIVRYFHHMASEAAARNVKTKGKHDREVPESEFRYPGPKPHSKESAILMVCDGGEGAVRALSEPTPGRIESTVHQVIMDRLNDGQFDDCDITLRELKLVEQSMVKSLCAIHHGRIKYPKGDRRQADTEESEGAEGSDQATDAASARRTAPEVAHQA